MKTFKLNLLCVFAVLLALTSCSKDELNESDVVLETPASTSISARVPDFCSVNFASELNYEITLVNRRNKSKTFKIARRNTDIQGAFGGITFVVTREIRQSNFFKQGIKSYIFRSNRALSKPLIVTGSINSGTILNPEARSAAGKRLNYSRNISDRVGNPKNLNDISINIIRTDKRCR